MSRLATPETRGDPMGKNEKTSPPGSFACFEAAERPLQGDAEGHQEARGIGAHAGRRSAKAKAAEEVGSRPHLR